MIDPYEGDTAAMELEVAAFEANLEHDGREDMETGRSRIRRLYRPRRSDYCYSCGGTWPGGHERFCSIQVRRGARGPIAHTLSDASKAGIDRRSARFNSPKKEGRYQAG